MSVLHLVGPTGLSDPARPSGGNVYDVRVAAALRALGRDVEVHETTSASLSSVLGGLPDGSTVVVDGLVGSVSPAVLSAAEDRLRVVVLVHLPVGLPLDGSPGAAASEGAALSSAAAVVCTSRWTRDWLAAEYGLPHERLHVVPPGTDKGTLAEGSASGHRFLSVGAITPVKGHDVLVSALASLADLSWTWTLVGASVDPSHATTLWASLHGAGLDDRVTLAGALTGPALSAAYASADLTVLPSRHETYGMVATESLARGVPVLASDVGGVREALGTPLPGLLVPPADPVALASALRSWLTDPSLRTRLQVRAADRRSTLSGWDRTATQLAEVLEGVGR
ncbi:MAG: glycosyltransferase family 4 protein [Nocardioides sp.]